MTIEKHYFSNKSKWTLKYFDAAIEKNYIDYLSHFKKLQMRYIALLTSFLYATYMIVDFIILEDVQKNIASMYHLSMVAVLIIPYITSYSKNLNKLTLYLLYFAPIYAAFGSGLMVYYGIYFYFTDMYMIILWVFITVGFMFVESICVNIILLSIYFSLILFQNLFKFEIAVTHVFYILVALSLGTLASYMIEFYRRDNFESHENLKNAKKKLKELVNRDALTHLYNRRYFDEISQELVHLVKREKSQLSIVMIDIDKFKEINDTYGHKIGDEVLKRLSSILTKHTRDSDVVVRYGGEEFVLLLPFTHKIGAFKIAEELRKTIQETEIFIDENKLIKFTISAGVDYFDTEDDENIYESLHRADEALYSAKNNGRNKVIIN